MARRTPWSGRRAVRVARTGGTSGHVADEFQGTHRHRRQRVRGVGHQNRGPEVLAGLTRRHVSRGSCTRRAASRRGEDRSRTRYLVVPRTRDHFAGRRAGDDNPPLREIRLAAQERTASLKSRANFWAIPIIRSQHTEGGASKSTDDPSRPRPNAPRPEVTGGNGTSVVPGGHAFATGSPSRRRSNTPKSRVERRPSQPLFQLSTQLVKRTRASPTQG